MWWCGSGGRHLCSGGGWWCVVCVSWTPPKTLNWGMQSCSLLALQAVGNEQLPPFSEGEVVPITEVELHQGKTSPPDYLTEAGTPTLAAATTDSSY